MKIIIFLLAFLSVLHQAEMAPKGNEKPVILISAFHQYSLVPPNGWECENQNTKGPVSFAVFYEKGYSFNTAGTMMFVNSSSMNNSNRKKVEDFMKADSVFYREHYPNVSYTTEKPVKINDNLWARLVVLNGSATRTFDAYAYIDAGKSVVIIGISSENKNNFDKMMKAFTELVKSYQFIAFRPSSR